MDPSDDATGESWDLFCRVVDNYGDIGIGWRLARQLAIDPRRSVRLFVDGLDAFARIEPRVDPCRERQALDRVTVLQWPQSAGAGAIATVVVELLGCGLPIGYLDAMVGAGSVWVDFEHLSAEAWVDGFHGLPSPHPRLPIVKHFFYPGFGPRTGGVLLEPGLERRRLEFIESPDAVDALWRRLRVPSRAAGEMRMSLFAYPDAPVGELLDALAGDAAHRWSVLVPGGGNAPRLRRLESSPTVMTIPFTSQDDYDRLLWACDVNFVRGEDSFVRAQAAGRPFVWQPYAQQGAVHMQKLEAFEDRYEAGMPSALAAVNRRFWAGWNIPGDRLRKAAGDWIEALPALAAHSADWRDKIASASPLVDRLSGFVAALRGSPGTDRLC